jgi:transcriptional regulator with XRE-family HTH domain
MNYLSLTLGERLKILIDESGLSRKKLTVDINEKLGDGTISEATITRTVSNELNPTQRTLRTFAQYFNISVDWLLGLSDARTLDISIQAAIKTTGLSEEVIGILQEYKKHCSEDYASITDVQYPIIDLDFINYILPLLLKAKANKTPNSKCSRLSLRRATGAAEREEP